MANASPWKRPDEVMQLHRLKKRKKALQERMSQPASSQTSKLSLTENESGVDFSQLIRNEKRKNPFTKNVPSSQEEKKQKADIEVNLLDESNDKTLFKLLNLSSPCRKQTPSNSVVTKDTAEKLSSFTNLLHKYSRESVIEERVPEVKLKKLPIDWSLKTKVRLMSPKPFAWNQRLKASEEASGITGFVRCLNTSDSNTLDTSYHARFHQQCLYWQHPHLPWLSLFPRSVGRATSASCVAGNDLAQAALHRDWTDSFRSLFQLVRARQCPYFYMCANTFTCLFRAAGVNGVSETSVLIAPTTRGFRHTLSQEDIEFTMPLRPNKKRSSLNSSDSHSQEDKDGTKKNNSHDSCYDTDETRSQSQSLSATLSQPPDLGDLDRGSGDEEEDLESDVFLTNLGLEAEEIKKINNTQVRVQQASESNVDSAAESLVCVQGVEAQALFNFLLNCKSIVSPTGPFTGVPPTLLAPNAFQGGTLQALKVRSNTIYSENKKYYSIEMRGPLLPTAIHSLFDLLKSSSDQFSATFAPLQATLAFSAAVQVPPEDESSKENNATPFNKENLSDCGMSAAMLQHFCHSDPNYIKHFDAIKYDKFDDSFTGI